MAGSEKNFRWEYVKSEYLVRFVDGNKKDWYIINEPQGSKSSTISQAVTCPHISTLLKSKNVYLSFDDENGIGTLPYLVNQILAGTGWSIGDCPTFLESDGETEKVRSLIDDSKCGAYELISKVCTLFNAYCQYNGDDKTIDFFSLSESGVEWEFAVGKNLDSISAKYNSSNIVTRLYVEGEYGDFGYVGIDNVNPTGLSYIMNFDYYKERGLFTDTHQAALDTYVETARNLRSQITAAQQELNTTTNFIVMNAGGVPFTVYELSGGEITATHRVNGATNDPENGDQVVGVVSSELSRYLEYPVADLTGYAYLIYFESPTLGQIGVNESSIEAKELQIKGWQKKLSLTQDQTRIEEYNKNIATLQTEIDQIYTSANGLYVQFYTLCQNAEQYTESGEEVDSLLAQLEQAEAIFVAAVGEMLRDGRWTDENYTVGQEQALYNDAVEMSKRLAFPEVSYSLTYKDMRDRLGWNAEDVEINTVGHIVDEQLNINDYGYIKQITIVHDNPQNNKIEITTDDGFSRQVSLESVMTRIAKMAELVRSKNAVYERAGAFSSAGQLASNRLNGMIDILQNKLSSSISNWYTDDRGNLMFESVSGNGAMMLCGEGLMIASGRNDDGSWNWRTLAGGEGLVADEITTGFLSAERILAGTITTDKVSSNFGALIDLSGNAITSRVSDLETNTSKEIETQVKQTAESWNVTASEIYANKKETDDRFSELENDTTTVKKFMNFGADFLTIGVQDSLFNVQITNTAINFRRGEEVLAYMDNSKLYIPESEVTKRMRIGSYVWMLPSNDGSAALIYMPA